MYYYYYFWLIVVAENLILTTTADYSSCIVTSTNKYCFSTPGTSLSWDDANEWCQNNKSALPVIINANTETAIEQFVQQTDSGLIDSPGTPYYLWIDAQLSTSTTWNWVDGENYVHSGNGILGNTGSDVQRATIQNDGGTLNLYIQPLSDQFHYICQNSGLEANCQGIYYNGKCLVKSQEDATWFEARNRCLLQGADLATSVVTSMPSAWINTTIYWVGLEERVWHWQMNGAEMNYTRWANNKPSTFPQQCVVIDKSGLTNRTWNDYQCTSDVHFLCLNVSAINPPSTTQPTTHLSSPLTTTTNTTTQNTTITQGNNALPTIALAVGVGVGVGVPVIIAVVLTIVCLLRRNRSQTTNTNSTKNIISSTTSTSINDDKSKKNKFNLKLKPDKTKTLNTKVEQETTQNNNLDSPDGQYAEINQHYAAIVPVASDELDVSNSNGPVVYAELEFQDSPPKSPKFKSSKLPNPLHYQSVKVGPITGDVYATVDKNS